MSSWWWKTAPTLTPIYIEAPEKRKKHKMYHYATRIIVYNMLKHHENTVKTYWKDSENTVKHQTGQTQTCLCKACTTNQDKTRYAPAAAPATASASTMALKGPKAKQRMRLKCEDHWGPLRIMLHQIRDLGSSVKILHQIWMLFAYVCITKEMHTLQTR